MKVSLGSNINFISQVKLRNSESFLKTFLLSAWVSDLHGSKGISPGNSVCHVCCALEPLCKLGEPTCPPCRCMSALACDHLPGMARRRYALVYRQLSVSHKLVNPQLQHCHPWQGSASLKQSACRLEICWFSLAYPTTRDLNLKVKQKRGKKKKFLKFDRRHNEMR